MQPHEQRDPEQRKPDPQDKRAMWLLLVIAILLGLITTRLLDRLSSRTPAGSLALRSAVFGPHACQNCCEADETTKFFMSSSSGDRPVR